MKIHNLYFLCFLLCLSCKPNSDDAATGEETNEESQKYTLTPFSPSPSYDDAAIEAYTYNNGTFSFDISGESYKLGVQTSDAEQKMCANSAEGQHLHVIVDNEPYAAKYEPVFDYEIPDGEHYLLVFLSRSYHESIKTGSARIAQIANIKDNTLVSGVDIDHPMIFYSRPKGIYVGKRDTEKVMLDFYLVNADTNEFQIKVEINGEEHILYTWQPYYIEGLPMGDNEITLTLLDRDGNIVEIPSNPVSRTFTLKADPAEDLE